MIDAADPRWRGCGLVRDMTETPSAVRAFDPAATAPIEKALKRRKKLLIVGEGSSRILPAKRAVCMARKGGLAVEVATEGCRQALECVLAPWTVLALSRSGKTVEVRALVDRLRSDGHGAVFEAGACEERAFASTKSVVLEALLVEALLFAGPLLGQRIGVIAETVERALSLEPRPAVLAMTREARHVYFAGREDGVAEELALKCAEIARKPSAFFEGSYLLHGARATLGREDVVVLVEPFPEDDDRVQALLARTGARAIAIATRDTPFETLRVRGIPEYGQLATGWRLLLEVGAANGVDLDGRDVQL